MEFKMNNRIVKLSSLAAFSVGCAVLATIGNAPQGVRAINVVDAAAVYKAKCAMCHTPKAEKFYDPAKSEDEHVQIVLKGKKGEKPPFMPGFEEKGMTAEEAKGLVQYMESLRQPPK